jgi:hypothetical protein
MSYDYLSVIKPFALQAFDPSNPPPSKWNLDAFRVARSLLRLLDKPDAITQSCFGICGQVAFLRAWAYRDPVAVAKFTLDLYANGAAEIGDYKVSASSDHLQSDWMTIPLVPDPPDPDEFKFNRWGVGNQITESVWMICGALAATEAGTLEHCTLGGNLPPMPVSTFNGRPAADLSTLTLPGELKRWLEKTGCYSSGVDDNTSTIGGKSLADDSFLISDFDDCVDVFLCINSDLFINATFTPMHDPVGTVGFLFNWFPNHWVMLKNKIIQSAGTITMNIWIWGGNYKVQVALDDFNNNYYGSVVARAAASRRTPGQWPLHNAISASRIYYSQDNLLHFEWQQTSSRVEWCELNSVNTAVVPTPVAEMLPEGFITTAMQERIPLQRIWTADGPGAFQSVLSMPDPNAPHNSHYEIAACRGDLRPNDCDPFFYNNYDLVPCNSFSPYEYSAPWIPLCETHTTHFRLRYYGYPCPKQIPDGLDPYTTDPAPRSDQSIQFAGETIGHCRHDGSTDIVWNGASIMVGTEPRTPLSIQKLAVWLEYFCHLLGSAPYALECIKDGKLIEITVGDGFNVQAGYSQPHKIGIDASASDQDLPALCLKMLFSLEVARSNGLPEWVFPAFVSRVAIVQTPVTTTMPVGFADFGGAFKTCEATTVYQAGWMPWGSSRTLQVDVRKPLNPLLPAHVFVEFAGKAMNDRSISLTLNGKSTSIPVALKPSADHQYYFGTFKPTNTWTADYTLDLVIQGTRSWPANVLKVLLGDNLDSTPGTIAALDPTPPGPFAFTNYEAGNDGNHHIEVGPQSHYARLAMLTPDRLEAPEPNDSFATATSVTSLILSNTAHKFGTIATVEKVFDHLNFHDQQDADYFDVSYQCPVYDDSDAVNRPATSGKSPFLGISYGHRPPELSCRVTPDDYHCMDVAAYKYDASAPVLFAGEVKSTGLTIASPSRTLGAKRCYFVLTNHNYAYAGAFFYTVRFAYTSTYDTITVDTNAPAYRGKLGIKRRILGKLYEHIDLPRPPEDMTEVIHVRDAAEFVKEYSKFLQEPETGALLGQSLQRNGGMVVAEALHFLGQLAQTFGRLEEAIGLYRKSADISRALGDKVGTVAALESLAGFYKSYGNVTVQGVA